MTRLLLVAEAVLDGEVLRSDDRPPRCLLLDGEHITWVGSDPADAPPHDQAMDLPGAFITPAFVDAHVHATATGLARSGVALAGATGPAEVLARVRAHRGGPAGVLLGSGWDDFGWNPRTLPSGEEIAAAAGGKPVVLTRIDAHSCLVDASLLERLPLDRLEGVERDADGRPTGWLREEASEAALTFSRTLLTAADLDAARRAACAGALALGIGSFHEMGHPGLSGLDDSIAWAMGDWPVDVVTWWAELDLDVAQRHGLHPGGDLFLDGSIGSCTAATVEPYGPAAERGVLFHDTADVAEWFVACTAAGAPAGVHAIGERAIEQALAAIEVAVARLGRDAVAACRHRIEHVELPTREQVARMATAGVIASIQPAFDAVWGGDAGLYAERFGAAAARLSNPFAWFDEEGVTMAFGSDSTVTPLDPLGGVRAALHHLGGLGINVASAVDAATLGGRRAARQRDVGRCRAGWRADLAVWSGQPFSGADVRCLSTVVRGSARYDVTGVADVIGVASPS